MNSPVPHYLYVYVLTGATAVVAAVFSGLRKILKSPAPGGENRRKAVWLVSVLMAAWYLSAVLLSWAGVYVSAPSRPPTLGLSILIPVIAGILLFQRSHALQDLVQAAPQKWMVGVQFYRVLGLIFLVLYAQGQLPGAFALPAGVGDAAVGLLALAVGSIYGSKRRSSAGLVRAWNWLGIVDLTVAVATGFLTSPSPLQMLSLESPNALISAFPLAIVPVFLVPFSFLLHLASLWKVRREGVGLEALHGLPANI